MQSLNKEFDNSKSGRTFNKYLAVCKEYCVLNQLLLHVSLEMTSFGLKMADDCLLFGL